MKANHAALPHQRSGASERSGGVGEVHENKSADSSVKPVGYTIERLRIPLYEAHIGNPGLRNTSRSGRHRFRIAFHPGRRRARLCVRHLHSASTEHKAAAMAVLHGTCLPCACDGPGGTLLGVH
jgi:hypothetical protein